MKISIIIPVYNAESFLGRCLDSLLAQSFQDFEIICIDDCGNDRSREILETYRTNYPDKIAIITNETNCGAGQSRNNGMAHAQGDYLVFVDSDDYLASDYLETYVRVMENQPCDIVIGGFIKDRAGSLETHPVSDSIWSVVTYPMACAKMWDRSFVENNQIRFGTTSCAEDTFFSLSAFIHNATYRVLDYEGYYYYQNAQSAIETTSYKQNHERMISKVFTDLMSQPQYAHITAEQRQVLGYTYLANMIDSLMNYNKGCGAELMKEKYRFILSDLNKKFPDYMQNPYIGFLKPKGETRIIRFGVGGFRLLKRLRLDKLFFSLIARL